MAGLAVLGVLAITFGNTIFNSLYLKQVLCQREEIGLHIFERVPLPAIYTNPETGLPKNSKPFLDRFEYQARRTKTGYYPSYFYQRENIVLDRESGRVLARYINYSASGGFWWIEPLAWMLETLFGGEGSAPYQRCITGSHNELDGLTYYFIEIYKPQGEKK